MTHVSFFNFRIDRPRQLSYAFVFNNFSKVDPSSAFDPYRIKYEKTHLAQGVIPPIEPFKRGPKINNLYFVTMTEYSKSIENEGGKIAFPPEIVQLPLGLVISSSGFKQLRVSESEKERFVTFYFNGQQESVFPGEDHLIIPSPKVATYDLKPEMSAREMTDVLLNKLKDFSDYKFILVNFANTDMVGHTGSIGACVKGCEVVDECLGKLSDWVLAYGGCIIITADHGNAEEMINSQTGEIETEHSSNPVPFVAIAKNLTGKSLVLTSGILADIAPTILTALRLEVPSSMTGRNLIDSQLWRN